MDAKHASNCNPPHSAVVIIVVVVLAIFGKCSMDGMCGLTANSLFCCLCSCRTPQLSTTENACRWLFANLFPASASWFTHIYTHTYIQRKSDILCSHTHISCTSIYASLDATFACCVGATRRRLCLSSSTRFPRQEVPSLLQDGPFSALCNSKC